MNAVHHSLIATGTKHVVWTETAGTRLDATFQINSDYINTEKWPHGVHLSWNQHHGWALVENDDLRNTTPLRVSTYAAPQAVVTVAHALLAGKHEPAVNETWDQADSTKANVDAWQGPGHTEAAGQ